MEPIWLQIAVPQMHKETLVMLPGMMCDRRLFEPQISALGQYCNIIVPLLDAPASIEGMAQKILNEIEVPTFNLLGLSMGGIVAMHMVGIAPQRVRRLALLDTNHQAGSSERSAIRNRQIADVKEGRLRQIILNEMKSNYLAQANRKNVALLELLMTMALDLGDEMFINQSLALRDRGDQTQALRRYHGTTLILCGDEDRLCLPSLHAEMAELLAHSTYRKIKDCGHISTLEQPNAVISELKNWLNLTAKTTRK